MQLLKHLGLTRILAVAALLVTAAPLGASPLLQLVVIGDSVSDTGNLYARTNGAFPNIPNWQGRYSNGPVWVEVLASELGMPNPAAYFGPSTSGQTNFAQGGATTYAQSSAPLRTDMPWQIDQLEADAELTGGLSDSLVVVFGGANDFFNAIQANPPQPINPMDSVNNLVALIERLIGLGAESLLLPNLPPIDQTPEFIARGSTTQAAADQFSTGFDATYQSAVSELQATHAGVDFYYFDVYSIIQDMLADPAGFGFDNVTQSYLSTSMTDNPDSYLYWDGVHVTRAGHREFGLFAAQLVPIPPVLLLLLPGLLILIGSRSKGGLRCCCLQRQTETKRLKRAM